MANTMYGTRIGDHTQFANSERPDAIILDMIENMQDLGVESITSAFLGEEKQKLKPELLKRMYYTTGTGLLEGGLNDEAHLGDSQVEYDEKKIQLRSFSRRFHLGRAVLRYGDHEHLDMFKVQVNEALADFWENFNQDAADMILRGWETSYKSGFKNQAGKNTVINGRDFEGSNPFFAPNHKIISGTPNPYRWNNVCVRKDGAGGYNINPPLSKDAIVDTYNYAQSIRNYKGNIVKGRDVNTIVCSVGAFPELWQLILSTHEVNTANNGIETFKLSIPGVNFFEWKRLSQDGEGKMTNVASGNSYNDYWFLVDMKNVQKEFKFQFDRKPGLRKETDIGNAEDELYFTRAEYTMHACPMGYTYGSNSTNTAAPADFVNILV